MNDLLTPGLAKTRIDEVDCPRSEWFGRAVVSGVTPSGAEPCLFAP